MSYILDALRRAESERANDRKVPGLHDQPLEPLLHPEPTARTAAPWLWALAGAGLAALGAMGWFQFRPTPAAPPPSPVAHAEQSAVAPAGVPPAPVLAHTPPAPAAPPRPLPVAVKPVTAPPVAIASPAAPTRVARPEPPEAPPVLAAAPTVPAASTAPAASQEGAIPKLMELPDDLRRALPPLRFEAVVYSEVAANRMLMINGQLLHEGEALSAELTVERIRPSSAVLRFRGQRFELARQ